MANGRPKAPGGGTLSRRTLLKSLALGAGAVAVGCGRELRFVQGEPRPRSEALESAVDHIVVLMLENRSFDHYFGALTSDPAYPGRDRVDGLRGTEWNPSRYGARLSPALRYATVTEDPPHGWKQAHAQFNDGLNDGFVLAAQQAGLPSPGLVMEHFDRTELPILYALADQYTVCDRWFASVMGPTWPNRFFVHATTSWGEKAYGPNLNPSVLTIWDLLHAAGHSAKHYYAGGISWYSGGFLAKAVLGGHASTQPVPLRDFFQDAHDGTLPEFSVIDPDFSLSDDHPPNDVRLGQAFVGSVVQAVADSPNWARTLLVITYDEHGGFYDHVVPPTVTDERPEFRQLGFRVPTLLVGPMVRAGHVLSTQFEHSTIASTLGARFGMPSLTDRMAQTEDLGCGLDPEVVAGRAPPLERPKLPTLSIERSQIQQSLSHDSQPELSALMRKAPRDHLNAESGEERANEWLRYADAFEVLKVK